MTAYAADAEGKIWNLAWDPALGTGIAGWRIRESRNGGAFSLVAEKAAGDLAWTRTLSTPGSYAWRVTAVSDSGVESATGPTLGGGYALAGTGGAPLAGNTLLLLKK